MGLNKLTKNISELFHKYKYALLVLVIGFILMMIPSQTTKVIEMTSPTEQHTEDTDFENKLAKILSKINGAGNVEVMITVAEGEEMRYQTNDRIDNEDANYDTVTVTDANRNQNGLIRQVIPATYKGIIVVCQGGDDPIVRLAIIDAVSKLTGLGSDKISILKMK